MFTLLGDGAYSQVYKVKRIQDGQIYALKKVRLNHLSEKERENAINEVRILASIKHVNVISYKEAFIEPTTQSLCIVMEFADNGDLFQKITENQAAGATYNEQDIWKIFIQIVRGLRALHDLNIMHRDLKSANVFLNKDLTVKLGDMNVSKIANGKGLNYTQTGTPYYASPEVWKDEPYDQKSDIWSLGCVLYEMIALRPPFQANDMNGLYKRVIRGQYQKLPKQYSAELANMVSLLLQVNPQNRPDSQKITQLSVFSKKFNEFFPDIAEQDKSELLKTIRIPKNIMYLSNRLPLANYNSNIKRHQQISKMYKSTQQRSSIRSINKDNSITIEQQDVKLPNLESNMKSIVNKKASYEDILTRQNSKIKLQNKNDQDMIQIEYQDKKSALMSLDHSLNESRINSLSPKQHQSSSKKKGNLIVSNINSHKNSIVLDDQPMIIAQSSANLHSNLDTPYDEDISDQLRVNQLPQIQSRALQQNRYREEGNSLSQQSSLNQKKTISLVKRDNSLKRLQAEKQSDSSLFLYKNDNQSQNQDSVKVSQQRLQDIYNMRYQKPTINNLIPFQQERKTRMNDISMNKQNMQLGQILVSSQKMKNQQNHSQNRESEAQLQRIQLKEQIKSINNSVKSTLFHNGVPINYKPKKNTVNYEEKLLKIANVYARGQGSMSPLQNTKPKKEYINHSMVINESAHNSSTKQLQDRYHSVSNSISNVKLPSLNNRSLISNDITSIGGVDLSQIEVFNPYENRSSVSNAQQSQKLLKKGQKQYLQSSSSKDQLPLPYQSQHQQNLKKQRQYLLMNQKNNNLNTSFKSTGASLTKSESSNVIQVNLKPGEGEIIETQDLKAPVLVI
ncbi:protein kinase domain containing protein [Stylonychia lemnae]|uniref:non-specific serine/threonine protein kinase n=1 Tax=Stylonychia lemnae TaxID=5949 RepID=A0A077ZTS5_STYLE|nr:protein kinase domain containing protein [Stylonychia lemnae]|eukprot:CDW72959.1 protein kinase domain containing protein [Stylonychia lemnae]